MTWWMWILAGLAALAALGAWVAWGVLSWPYETWEGDEHIENAPETHQIDAHANFDALPMGRHTQPGKTAQTTILENEGWDG